MSFEECLKTNLVFKYNINIYLFGQNYLVLYESNFFKFCLLNEIIIFLIISIKLKSISILKFLKRYKVDFIRI